MAEESEDEREQAPGDALFYAGRGDEALFYVGHKNEAQKQFALAAHLDLSAIDRATLARWMDRAH